MQAAGCSQPSPLVRIERGLALAFIVGLLSGVLWCAQPELFPSAQESFQQQLWNALRDRQQNVEELAARYLSQFPNDAYAIWFAAEVATQHGDHDEAIAHYQQLPQDGSIWEFQRELGIGQRCFALGRLADSERSLRRALDLNPYHLEANNRLGHLLQICGRVWESTPYFFVQIQRGKCRGDELLGMSVTDRFFRHDERLERMGAEPDSPALPIRLAEARRAIYENREDEAEHILREILAVYPHLGEAQGRLGRIIVERGDIAEFLQWRGSLPEEARRHPEVLFVEGLQARRLGQIEGAIHCFLERVAPTPSAIWDG